MPERGYEILLKSLNEKCVAFCRTRMDQALNSKFEWSTKQLVVANFNSKALNAIFMIVSPKEFGRISNVEIAKAASMKAKNLLKPPSFRC